MDVTFNPLIHKGTRSGQAKKTEKGQGKKFADGLSQTSDAEENASAEELKQLTGIQSLLEVQEATAYADEKQKVALYGGQILDQLEQLRLHILTGQLTDKHLQQLAKDVQQQLSQKITDPKLKTLLNEIEVRAAVELAKRGY